MPAAATVVSHNLAPKIATNVNKRRRKLLRFSAQSACEWNSLGKMWVSRVERKTRLATLTTPCGRLQACLAFSCARDACDEPTRFSSLRRCFPLHASVKQIRRAFPLYGNSGWINRPNVKAVINNGAVKVASIITSPAFRRLKTQAEQQQRQLNKEHQLDCKTVSETCR